MFVCEIPEGVTEADIWTLFGAVGEVEDVSDISPKRFTFVRFAQEAHAMYAIGRLDNHLLPSGAGHAGGRLRVKWTRKKIQSVLAPSNYDHPLPGASLPGPVPPARAPSGKTGPRSGSGAAHSAAPSGDAAESDGGGDPEDESGRRIVSYDDDFLFD